MQTYRVYLIGEADGVVYGIKEYEAANEASAAQMAESLVPDNDPGAWWGDQRLIKEIGVAGAR
jgi:hypothetical protein